MLWRLKFTVESGRQHLSLALLPGITEIQCHRSAKPHCWACSPLAKGELFLKYMTAHLSPLCFPVWLNSGSSPLFSNAKRDRCGAPGETSQKHSVLPGMQGRVKPETHSEYEFFQEPTMRWRGGVSVLDSFFFFFLQWSFCREMKLMYKTAFLLTKVFALTLQNNP